MEQNQESGEVARKAQPCRYLFDPSSILRGSPPSFADRDENCWSEAIGLYATIVPIAVS
jgi:hypothetical protein